MISIEKCRELLGEKGKHLSVEQLKGIRKVLVDLAKINIKIIEEQKTKGNEKGNHNV